MSGHTPDPITPACTCETGLGDTLRDRECPLHGDPITPERCEDCGHQHTPNGCIGPPTASDRWAGVSPVVCDCGVWDGEATQTPDPITPERVTLTEAELEALRAGYRANNIAPLRAAVERILSDRLRAAGETVHIAVTVDPEGVTRLYVNGEQRVSGVVGELGLTLEATARAAGEREAQIRARVETLAALYEVAGQMRTPKSWRAIAAEVRALLDGDEETTT